MKKKKNVRTIIRQIVREEVAMAIHEVITELKQPIKSQPQPQKKIAEKKTFTKNSVLNDMLNETASDGSWETLGGETFDSSKMNQVMSSQYGGMMNNSSEVNADAMIASMGENPNSVPEKVKDNIFNKDYRALMKAMDKKSGK